MGLSWGRGICALTVQTGPRGGPRRTGCGAAALVTDCSLPSAELSAGGLGQRLLRKSPHMSCPLRSSF